MPGTSRVQHQTQQHVLGGSGLCRNQRHARVRRHRRRLRSQPGRHQRLRTLTTTNQRKPFFQKFGWTQNLRYYGCDASNNYHSLQLRFDKRFASGFNVMSHYTWSKNIDYDGTYYPRDAKPCARRRQLITARTSSSSRRCMKLPFGKGRKYLNQHARSRSIWCSAAGS